jgi:hypothetical protein
MARTVLLIVLCGCAGTATLESTARDQGSSSTANTPTTPMITTTATTDTTGTTETTGTTPWTTTTITTDSGLYDPNRVLEIRITMDPADADALAAETRELLDLLEGEDCLDDPFDSPFTWYHADVVVDGEHVADVGIRKKGLIGSLSSEKPSIKLKFDKWVDGQELLGVERLTLNNNVADPSEMRQCLAYDLFRRAGLPAPLCNFAHVVVNGEDLGVYTNVEPLKRAFLSRNFADSDGDLYEGTLSDFRDGWTETFEAKTDGSDESRAPIHAVVEALEASDATLLGELDAVLDLDAFYQFWAMEVLIGHWDGYAGNTNNFFVYRDPADDRLVFMPWGIDLTFFGGGDPASEQPDGVLASGALAQRLYALPEAREAYSDALSGHLAGVWNEAQLASEMDRMEALVAPYVLDPILLSWAAGELDSWVEARRDILTEELDAGLDDWPWGLRGNPCMVEVGTVQSPFETTWSTLYSDPFSEGDGSISFTWDGWPGGPIGAGAVAGESYGYGLIATTGWATGTEAYQVIAQVPVHNIRPGTHTLDMMRGVGVFNYLDLSIYPYFFPAAYIADGALVLEEASTSPGAPIRGRIEGTLYEMGF